ncbi:hypothetical protein MBAV_006053 [Candidatus Magnetobacterium bavaricum]|uniref:Uncharacterized protein n=1 Tax=Candidatus Magnetobacterium bavaricum TaxID=29290 RepID=A0A0F3GIH0_9BACT|nr:hypothetical protein MBAV_006053 [Candidatus Magnetobacterium bavaricum]
MVQSIIKSTSENVLCIGDQGQVGGNDDELLSWQPSISVGRLRPASNMCLWIGQDSGLRESEGLLSILRAIRKTDNSFRLTPSLFGHI